MKRFLLFGGLFVAHQMAGQQKQQPDTYPSFLKLYSNDGRESLTALCRPTVRRPEVKEISCEFANARFQPPPGQDNELVAVVETLKEDLKNEGKDAKTIEVEFARELEATRLSICSELRKMARDQAELGPKKRDFFGQVLSACAAKDPMEVVRRLSDHKQRTCNIWIDHFSLEFTKLRAGQWLYRQEEPGLLSKALKIYELTGEGSSWLLAETRVPTEGSDEKPSRTVWSSRYTGEYELPCDFIEHTHVQAP